jgi:hypothetical protein
MVLVIIILLVKLDILGFQMLVFQFHVVLDPHILQAVHAVKYQFINVHQELIGTDIDVFLLLKHVQSAWSGIMLAVVFQMVLNVQMVLI